MNLENLIKDINKTRKENKGSWYFYKGKTSSGQDFKIKAYDTWVQRLEIGDLVYSSGMEIKVSEFKDFLKDNLI